MKLKSLRWLGIIFLILLAVRMILPQASLYAINWTLENKLDKFVGHLDDFDLSLYRGAYQLEGLTIRERNSRQPPILQVERMDLQVAWKPLFEKEISANVHTEGGVLRFFDSKDNKKKQVGDSSSWQKTLGVLVPAQINTLVIKDWAVYFANNDLAEPVPVRIEQISLSAENLRTRPENDEESLVPVTGSALLQKHVRLKLNGRLDGLAAKPRADIDIQVSGFHMNSLNKLLLAYVPLDITKGDMSLFAEVATSNGNTKGYINVFLKEADVIAPNQDYSGLKHFGFELVGAFANWFLQNDAKKELASHVPFSGSGSEFNIDAKSAFWSAVENRNEDRLKPGLQNSIDLQDVEGKNKINSASR